jgi:lysozyme
MVNLIFNMGMSTFRKFKKTIQHMENKEYELAGAELLNSRYAEQVGQRAIEVANQLAEK